MRVTTRLALGLLVAVLTVLMAACGNDAPTRSKENSMDNRSQVSMEKAIERYDQMRQEMFEALEAELGPRKWAVTPNDSGPTRAACNDDDEAETVVLPAYGFQGSYPESEWKQAAAIVEKAGRGYGFDEVKVVVDRPGDLSLTGLSKDGGSYDFGMATNTVLGIRTGCHRWATTPAPED